MTVKPDQPSEFEFAPFRVEEGKIKEFAAALGLTNPVYFDRRQAAKQGYRAIPAPPTFATVHDYWNDRNLYELFSQLNLDQRNLLHGEQSFEFKQTIYAGDVLRAKLIVTNKLQKKDKTFYYTETVYWNDRGELVLISRATFVDVSGSAA